MFSKHSRVIAVNIVVFCRLLVYASYTFLDAAQSRHRFFPLNSLHVISMSFSRLCKYPDNYRPLDSNYVRGITLKNAA